MEGLIKMTEELMDYINEEIKELIISVDIRGWCNSIEILVSPIDFDKFKHLGEYIEEPKIIDNKCIKYMIIRVNDFVSIRTSKEVNT